jgi:hypothetical protein
MKTISIPFIALAVTAIAATSALAHDHISRGPYQEGTATFTQEPAGAWAASQQRNYSVRADGLTLTDRALLNMREDNNLKSSR